MKKSTGVILILIIVLLLGVIGVGGYYFIKRNDDANKEIGNLKSIVANLRTSTDNATEDQVTNDVQTNTTDDETTTNDTQSPKTMKEISGQYTYEIKDDNGDAGVYNLYLAGDGTFGYFGEVGGNTGSYSIEGDKVILNVIFSHGGGVGLNVVKEQKTLILKDDGSIETNDLYANETITLKKVSNSISNFDIRTNIRGSIGTGPDYSITYNY